MSPRPAVRIAGANEFSAVAFVRLTPDAREVRVRLRPKVTVCDEHGRQSAPSCAHALAVVRLDVDLPTKNRPRPRPRATTEKENTA
jgi:hypothetical protein